jgi:hypothetical protein
MCKHFGPSAPPQGVHASCWLLESLDSLVAQSRRDPDATGQGFINGDGRPSSFHH